MKQMSLKLKMHVKSASIINNDVERITLRFIFWSFLALSLLYVLLLGNMVSNIIERRSLEISARALGSEVRDLELTYLSVSNNVDLALSYSMGFREAKASFATRKSLGLRPLDGPFGSINSAIKTLQNDI